MPLALLLDVTFGICTPAESQGQLRLIGKLLHSVSTRLLSYLLNHADRIWERRLALQK